LYIYLAHPIDQSLERARSPLASAIGHLHVAASQQGHALFRPGAAHKLPAPPWDATITAKVDSINRNAVWEADAVIAVLPPGVPTLGVPAEIEHALTLNRPTLIVTTPGLHSSSIQIQGWQRRGCSVLLMEDSGHLPNWNLAELLSSLPDPTRLYDYDGVVNADNPPPLLVSGQTDHLTVGKYAGDAGFDLAISEDVQLLRGHYQQVRTGVHIAVPEGWYAAMEGRSSTWEKHRCWVRPAVIDAGYRGEMLVGIEYRGDSDGIQFEAGTRLAQLILLPVFQGGIEVVDELPEADRGHAGFGSSGY
jgi:dUTP pyrophosphatase